MEDEVIIDESNILDLKDQDLEGLESLLECEEFNIDTTPEPLEISSCENWSEEDRMVEQLPFGDPSNEESHSSNVAKATTNSKREEYRICKCGNIIYKNHKSEFRCGACGCIIYGGSE